MPCVIHLERPLSALTRWYAYLGYSITAEKNFLTGSRAWEAQGDHVLPHNPGNPINMAWLCQPTVYPVTKPQPSYIMDATEIETVYNVFSEGIIHSDTTVPTYHGRPSG